MKQQPWLSIFPSLLAFAGLLLGAYWGGYKAMPAQGGHLGHIVLYSLGGLLLGALVGIATDEGLSSVSRPDDADVKAGPPPPSRTQDNPPTKE